MLLTRPAFDKRARKIGTSTVLASPVVFDAVLSWGNDFLLVTPAVTYNPPIHVVSTGYGNLQLIRSSDVAPGSAVAISRLKIKGRLKNIDSSEPPPNQVPA